MSGVLLDVYPTRSHQWFALIYSLCFHHLHSDSIKNRMLNFTYPLLLQGTEFSTNSTHLLYFNATYLHRKNLPFCIYLFFEKHCVFNCHFLILLILLHFISYSDFLNLFLLILYSFNIFHFGIYFVLCFGTWGSAWLLC